MSILEDDLFGSMIASIDLGEVLKNFIQMIALPYVAHLSDCVLTWRMSEYVKFQPWYRVWYTK